MLFVFCVSAVVQGTEIGRNSVALQASIYPHPLHLSLSLSLKLILHLLKHCLYPASLTFSPAQSSLRHPFLQCATRHPLTSTSSFSTLLSPTRTPDCKPSHLSHHRLKTPKSKATRFQTLRHPFFPDVIRSARCHSPLTSLCSHDELTRNPSTHTATSQWVNQKQLFGPGPW